MRTTARSEESRGGKKSRGRKEHKRKRKDTKRKIYNKTGKRKYGTVETKKRKGKKCAKGKKRKRGNGI